MSQEEQERIFDIDKFSKESLCKALSNEHIHDSEIENIPKVTYFYDYLTEIHTKTIVVEYNYTDGDYLDDFASFYVKCFVSYKRRCNRIHFFSTKFERDEFLQMVRGTLNPERAKEISDLYSGFIVARPLPNAIIGRTLLKVYENDNGRRNYTCTKLYSANLFGIALEVKSLAFQEQDTVLAACATVSLWNCFHKTSELFGTSLPTPAAITSAATQVLYPGRTIPSHGLTIEQMCDAIRQVGLEPEVIDVNKNTVLVSLIYSHLKMGIPVILGVIIEGVGRHAITITGYSLIKQKAIKQKVIESASYIPMIGLRIDEFYVHDDQIGPFARLYIKPSKQVKDKYFPVTFEGGWRNNSTDKPLTFYPETVIIPIYHKIRVTFIDIQQWIKRLHDVVCLILKSNAPLEPLEWDPHLITCNDLKKDIKLSKLPLQEIEKLLLKQHPRFIWRATLRYGDDTILEMLADATDMARSLPIYYISWHDQKFKVAFKKEVLLSSTSNDYFLKVLTRNFLEFLNKSINSENSE